MEACGNGERRRIKLTACRGLKDFLCSRSQHTGLHVSSLRAANAIVGPHSTARSVPGRRRMGCDSRPSELTLHGGVPLERRTQLIFSLRSVHAERTGGSRRSPGVSRSPRNCVQGSWQAFESGQQRPLGPMDTSLRKECVYFIPQHLASARSPQQILVP